MEFTYYFYCLHKFHWTPQQFMELSTKDLAVVTACIDIKAEDGARKEKELERQREQGD